MQLKDLLPQGVATLYEDEYEFKEDVVVYIKDIFKSYGYRQILTPTFEYMDLYQGIMSKSQIQKMVKVIDEKGDVLVIRPDATIPVARLAARNQDQGTGMLKYFYINHVYQVTGVEGNLDREYLQGGVESYGSNSPNCDAEIISMGIATLKACGINDFHVDIGQIKYLEGLLDAIDDPSLSRSRLIELIESKNQEEMAAYLDDKNIDEVLRSALLALPKLYGKPKSVLETAKQYVMNPMMADALDNLTAIVDAVDAYGYSDHIILDLGFANALNYYTGIVFKGYVNHFGKPLFQGGRYDQLVGKFGKGKPACGFGMNIDNLIEVMNMYETKEKVKCCTDYLILYTGNWREQAIGLSQSLRDKGYVVETEDFEGDTMDYLDQASFRNTREVLAMSGDLMSVINIAQNNVEKKSVDQFVDGLERQWITTSIH